MIPGNDEVVLSIGRFVSGHGFSRAAEAAKRDRALAPASDHSAAAKAGIVSRHLRHD